MTSAAVLSAVGAVAQAVAADVRADLPSPAQGVWHLGPVPLRAYALCILAGIVLAVIIAERRLVARGGPRGATLDIAAWAVPFGIVGARLYHVFTSPQAYVGAAPVVESLAEELQAMVGESVFGELRRRLA